MMQNQNFHEKLEADLKRLGLDVQEAREKEGVSAPRPEREILKESIRSFAERAAPSAAHAGEENIARSAPEPQAAAPAAAPAVVAPDYAAGMSPEAAQEVARLVDVVFAKGLVAGVREAKKQSPFVEDAFHDALVDHLLPELKKRGILK
ncbi:MAG: hypothetical protein V1656_02680 [Candidatus Jorgensenbacteria bacterium]